MPKKEDLSPFEEHSDHLKLMKINNLGNGTAIAKVMKRMVRHPKEGRRGRPTVNHFEGGVQG
jgi:hypothetical protein